ncbi:hypothetical protein Gotri_005794, partial [Gossypium trilobum]|nr:hypothetical protein [Gossypium trilobum]
AVIVGDARSITRKLQIEQEDRSIISTYIKDSKELKGIRRWENTYLEGGIPDFVVDEPSATESGKESRLRGREVSEML